MRSCRNLLLIVVGLLFATAPTSAVTEVGGLIDIETNWPQDTYWVTQNITVQIGVELTIAPGSVVKFAPGRSMTIQGSLDATGTPSNKIVFTSDRDVLFGEHVVPDEFPTPAPGDWGSLSFSSTVNPTFNSLEHCVFRFASGWTRRAAGPTRSSPTGSRTAT